MSSPASSKRRCSCRLTSESSLADLVRHKTNMLAPFIKAARTVIMRHALEPSATRHAWQQPPSFRHLYGDRLEVMIATLRWKTDALCKR